ncbi:hypothetical protein GCM10025768_15590 [Microbacterium pseudoresistens]
MDPAAPRGTYLHCGIGGGGLQQGQLRDIGTAGPGITAHAPTVCVRAFLAWHMTCALHDDLCTDGRNVAVEPALRDTVGM